MNFLKFSESLSRKESKKSHKWITFDVDIAFEGLEPGYELAYQYARGEEGSPDFLLASVCLMQIKTKRSLNFSGIPTLTYEQLEGITAANPACATRLLADPRNILLLNNLTRLTRYLSVAEHTYKILFDYGFILNLIYSHESLGKVIQVAPNSMHFLLNEKKLSKLIQYESNLVDIAKRIPGHMLKLLENSNLVALIKSPEALSALIRFSPELIVLLNNPRLNSLLSRTYYKELSVSLKYHARANAVAAQKALGIAHWEGFSYFKRNEEKALSYLQLVGEEDQFCADKVGEICLKQLHQLLETESWEFEQFSEIANKVPTNSKHYRETIILIAHTVLMSLDSILDQSKRLTKQDCYRFALLYLIEAFELKKDEFVTTLLDQTLNTLYLNNNFLIGTLSQDTREQLIKKVREETSSSSLTYSKTP